MGTDSDLEALPEPHTGGAPAEPAPPAGSVHAICPAWKRGHCTGDSRCPKQHPQPSPDDGALPEVKPAGVAQGLILDETARGSVNIQEAVERVTHAGQAAVALHTRGRHGRPAEGIIVEPSGMVLVLAADMVGGVLHASRVRRACPQWTIQVYTPPRARPFSTWAVLAVMWHLAPEDAPTLPLWYLPMGTLAHATQAVKGAFPQPLLPGVALLRSLQAGAAWVRWKEGKGRSSPYFPMVQGQALIHAEGMGTVEWGASCPARRAGGSRRPPHSPCDRRQRATASYGWSPLWPPSTPLQGTCGRPY